MTANIEERLERLERENRRLKLASLGAGALLCGMVLMGQAAPKGNAPDVIRARAFEVVDPSGKMVSRWELDGDAGRLRLFSQSGTAGINLVAADNGTFIDVMGQLEDNTFVSMGVKEGRYAGPYITITRDNDCVFSAPGEFYREFPPPL